jgi:hypothetical protein
MPFDIRIDPGRRLAVVRVWGQTDIESIFERMRGMRADPAFEAGMPILIDIRTLDWIPTVPDAERIAASYRDPALLKGHRAAIVAPRGAAFGMASMVSTLARLEDAEVEAFESEDAALDWLERRART